MGFRRRRGHIRQDNRSSGFALTIAFIYVCVEVGGNPDISILPLSEIHHNSNIENLQHIKYTIQTVQTTT